MARYIDADKLRTMLELERIGTDFFCGYGFKRAIWHIKHTPTADVVEVKHGEWILLDECSNEGVYCSECHKKVYRKEYANQKVKSKFCPNCGAKMDGKDESNET